MEYFEICNNNPFEKQWTRAFSIRSSSHDVSWHCAECERGVDRPSGSFDVVLEGGTAFPDFLCCGAFPFLIVSGRVVSVWKEAGVGRFATSPVGIVEIRDSVLRSESAPEYFRIEIAGECAVDLAASGISVAGVCKRCGALDRVPPAARVLRIFDGSWDGSDLFRDVRHFPGVNFCTERIVELVRSSGFTNVAFERMSG
ncbi:hypothetical protein Mal4_35580 [Maioricimonas rarisocia]|uniref:Uncharacterized protein n=1 Tax=Maioricimonas rarisocia TaxID=2528026 RepID=A0A517Z9U9_9PLAN|nr:hypothetical protein Mal4_35580 [Maioricimonas rarisocia]